MHKFLGGIKTWNFLHAKWWNGAHARRRWGRNEVLMTSCESHLPVSERSPTVSGCMEIGGKGRICDDSVTTAHSGRVTHSPPVPVLHCLLINIILIWKLISFINPPLFAFCLFFFMYLAIQGHEKIKKMRRFDKLQRVSENTPPDFSLFQFCNFFRFWCSAVGTKVLKYLEFFFLEAALRSNSQFTIHRLWQH